MLSLAAILNPERPQPRGTRLPSSAPSSLCASSSSTHGSPQSSTLSPIKKQKMTKDGAVFSKGKIKGEVNYPPFEQLNEETLREVEKFHVYPLGKIQAFCRHIPYNSEKKSFLEKTGRGSFEVFQYTFKVPGDDKEYCVMWDYNIGLVRITPFFKCCKYSKTTPAKMLNSNAGLKEITHSITGGALAAQGYWMPFECAREVCMTFCAHIAPALIPIFGPDFPSQCVDPAAPEHGRFTISPSIIHAATAQAEAFRVHYSSYSSSSKSSSRESYSPQHNVRQHEKDGYGAQPLGKRLRLKRAFGGDSPYETTTDTDPSESSNESTYFHTSSPLTSSSYSHLASRPRVWGHSHQNTLAHQQNHNHTMQPYKAAQGPNPLLSAIPRSTGVVDMQMALQVSSSASSLSNHASHNHNHRWQHHQQQQHAPIRLAPINMHTQAAPRKRRIIALETDEEYDGGESGTSVGSPSKVSEIDEDVSMVDVDADGEGEGKGYVSVCSSENGNGSSGGAEKKAALMLMKLSVKDGEVGVNGGTVAQEGDGLSFGARRGFGTGLGPVFNGSGNGEAGLGSQTAVGSPSEEDGPRIKRLRAASA